jgi:FixJ family two-component response regulator
VDVRSPSPSVVFIEDDPDLLCALTFAFEIEGYDVKAFCSADPALADDLAGAACLVIDYVLPDASGLDILKGLRRDGWEGPAVLITSHPQTRVKEFAASLGAVVIEKPLLSDELVDAVGKLTLGAFVF